MYIKTFSSYGQRENWINNNFGFSASVHGLVEIPPLTGNITVFVALVLESMKEMETFSDNINGAKGKSYVQMLCLKIMKLINEQDSSLTGCGIDVSTVSRMYK